MIDLEQASFVGPPLNDSQTLDKLPLDLRSLLITTNGFIVFDGGLHVRGICDIPEWHSLDRVWNGEDALSLMYSSVQSSDIPFAEDFLGDQFLLRGGLVVRLFGETGQVEELGISVNEFLNLSFADPNEFLSLNLLRQFQSEGATLESGQLLSVYPPLCTTESSSGVSMRAVPTIERIRFLADFARQIECLPEGTIVRVKVT